MMSKPWENKPWEANSDSWKNPEYKKNNEAWKNPPYKAMNATWQDKWGTRVSNEKIANMEHGLYFQYSDIKILRLMELVFSYAGLDLTTRSAGWTTFRRVNESVLEKGKSKPQSNLLRNILSRALLGISLDSENESKSPYILRFRNDIGSSEFAVFNIGISEKLSVQMYNIVLAISSQSKGSYKIPEYILVCWIAHEIVEQMYYIQDSGQTVMDLYKGTFYYDSSYRSAHSAAIEYANRIFQELSGYEGARLYEITEGDRFYNEVVKSELLKLSKGQLKKFNFVEADLRNDMTYAVLKYNQRFKLLSSDSIQILSISWWVVTDGIGKFGFSQYNLTNYPDSNMLNFQNHQGFNID